LIVLFLRIPSTNSEQSLLDKLKAIDWLGMGLFAASITMLLIGLSWGGIMFAWNSVATLIPLLLGALLLLIWAMYSYGICKSPMIPLVVLADRTAAISYFGTVLQGIIVSVITITHNILSCTNVEVIVLWPSLLPASVLSNRKGLLACFLWPRNTPAMSLVGPIYRFYKHGDW
jgi:hypothetical protein